MLMYVIWNIKYSI